MRRSEPGHRTRRASAAGALRISTRGGGRALRRVPKGTAIAIGLHWGPCHRGSAAVAIPVTDVDRAREFYVDRVGFHADHDYQVTGTLRFVQLTPPGSACSIVMGTGITEMAPGSQKGVQVVVADVGAARRELIAHGVQASEVDVQPWGSFVTFSDPDGNTWTLQQLPPRP